MDKHYYFHLEPNILKDKDIFLRATFDIENSFTGRVDILTSGLHRFFLESSKLIRNSIKLYEEGVFDAAFYSVRSALELARIVAYFSDDNKLPDSDEYKNWMRGDKFPFDSTIRKQLETSGSVYTEVHQVLEDFFNEQKEYLAYIQKYIHKQGYKTFYERGFINPDKEKCRREKIAEDFYRFLKGTLTEIAFLRLCIDPFPILLRDSDVRYKIHFQGMSDSFGDDFVKIIGEDKIQKYCTTEIYLSHVNYFKDNEELTEEAHTLINYQFYDRKTWPIIQRQLKLLSRNDLVAVRVFNLSKEITKIYMVGGWLWYFSDTTPDGEYSRFSSEDLLKIKESETQINSEYKEVFMSFFDFDDGGIWIEHNKPLTKLDIDAVRREISLCCTQK